MLFFLYFLSVALSCSELTEHETPLKKKKKKAPTERSVVCFLALKHQGTVVLLKIVNYVCLRKCQCFLNQNNSAGADLAVLAVTKVSCKKNDAFILTCAVKGSNDLGTMRLQSL